MTGEVQVEQVEPVLRASNLVMDFAVRARGGMSRKTRTLRAVDDVSFELVGGETLAIVGESGSGKSTTARIVARLLQPTAGRIEIEGNDVTHASRRELAAVRRKVQFVFQDPYSSLNPRHNVEEIVSAPLRYEGIDLPAGGAAPLVKDLMERVGLNPDHSSRYPAQFSGGQAQRIGIARAMAIRPAILICDEPVSALDVSVQAQVLDLLKELQREHAFSYVFITHDLAVVRQIAHRVAVMHDGRLVETGDRDSIFDHPQHDYTRTLLEAVPRIRFAAESPGRNGERNHDEHQQRIRDDDRGQSD